MGSEVVVDAEISEKPEGMELKVRRSLEDGSHEMQSNVDVLPDSTGVLKRKRLPDSISTEAVQDTEEVPLDTKRKMVPGDTNLDISLEAAHDTREVTAKQAESNLEGTSNELVESTQPRDKQEVKDKPSEVKDKPVNTPRYKKRKVVIYISYSGYGYQGMQKNQGAKTIEGELENALYRAGAIAESTFGDPRKIDWCRAARTDKGVSAVGQVVSGRFFIDPPGFVERVNQHLPKQIRVMGFTRVTGGFSAKTLCDRRRYEYVLPIFALDPNSHRQALNPESLACECETGSKYVFTDEQRAKLSSILQNYVGTHNFHNFTCRVKPEDPSTQRYIISYEVGDVFTIDGQDFVRCVVLGQSFMLHQIRKMIGLAVAVMRGCASESIYERAFRRDVKIGVPTAPELGLFLDECLYTAYNKRYAETHEEVSLRAFEGEIKAFKHEVIYPHIASMEAKERVFGQFLHGLTLDKYPDLREPTPTLAD